jgi:hypothetical protein
MRQHLRETPAYRANPFHDALGALVEVGVKLRSSEAIAFFAGRENDAVP